MTDENFVETLNGISVGDIVTTYHKGFHVVTKIERRFVDEEFAKRFGDVVGREYNALVHYKLIVNSSGKRIKANKEKQCDIAYVENAKKELKKQQQIVENIRIELENYEQQQTKT